MSKKASAERMEKLIHLFQCPICNRSMKVDQLKSVKCTNHHTFDFAKQGYVNLLTRPVKTQYDKKLFQARHAIIHTVNLYEPLHQEISTVIDQKMAERELVVLDAGCGEGSHLHKIGEEKSELKKIGLDISKEGILLAAKKYKSSTWFVGDLANLPFRSNTVDLILNILSPANYKEFNRVLSSDGLVVKVVPRKDYLKELRHAFFEQNEADYDNEGTVTLFRRHFQLIDQVKLSYEKELNETELKDLVEMTPLSWNKNEEQIDQFLKKGIRTVTVDLDVLIGRKMK